MKRFAHLFHQLDSTTKTSLRLEALVRYLREAQDEDKLWCIALLCGKRPTRPINSTLMRTWAAESAGIPLWLFEESYHIVGDLGETIALLVPQEGSAVEKPLHVWMNELVELRSKSDEEKKKYLVGAWKGLDKNERFILNKLIGGSFRMGVSEQNAVKALAEVTGKSTGELSHALMGNWTPFTTTYHDLVHEHTSRSDISKPYPFYLAYALEEEVAALGDVHEWQVERKWDGIRGQVVIRNNQVFIWSRGEELVTDKFPEFQGWKNFVGQGLVIDGEIICHDGTKPLPFQLLQTRIGRKNVTRSHLVNSPVRLIAYDVLEYEGQDMRSTTMAERRTLLEKVAAENHHSHLLISGLIREDSWEKVAAVRERSREEHSEGLMLKRKTSEYKAGRKRGDWWKWKVNALTIDAVMIYAMQGSGRRANLFTDYTFAVWDNGQLVPFTKAYSGLTDEEIKKVDAFVRRNTVEKFGPVRSVKPELVFEIAFEGIQRSTRHKSGIALRFPRIHRWRTDKNPEEANTKEDLLTLLKE